MAQKQEQLEKQMQENITKVENTQQIQRDIPWSSLSWKRYKKCPYNDNHNYPEMYEIFHLAKCPDAKKKDKEFKRCFFNQSHRVKLEDYESHLKQECKDIPKDYNIDEVLNPDKYQPDWDNEDLSNIDPNNQWLSEEVREKAKEYQQQQKIKNELKQKETQKSWDQQCKQQNTLVNKLWNLRITDDEEKDTTVSKND